MSVAASTFKTRDAFCNGMNVATKNVWNHSESRCSGGRSLCCVRCSLVLQLLSISNILNSTTLPTMPLICTTKQRDCIRAGLANKGEDATTWSDSAIIQCGKVAAGGSAVGGAVGGAVGFGVDCASHGLTCGCGTVKGAGTGAALGGAAATSYCGVEFVQCWTKCRK